MQCNAFSAFDVSISTTLLSYSNEIVIEKKRKIILIFVSPKDRISPKLSVCSRIYFFNALRLSFETKNAAKKIMNKTGLYLISRNQGIIFKNNK